MQLRCCGMHTSLFPTRRIRLIGQVRTSSSSLCIFPPCLSALLSKEESFSSYFGVSSALSCYMSFLVFCFQIQTLCRRDFFFLFFFFLSPELFPLPSQPRLPFSISALLFSLSWVWTFLRQNPFPKSNSFLFAYFLRLCCTPALSQSRCGLRVSIWDENLVQIHSIF